MDQTPSPDAAARGLPPRTTRPTDQELLKTLFDLGRQVAAVLDLDELLHKIPAMIARLVDFQAFAAYLLDEKRGELSVAHAVGYPPGVAATLRLKIGQGLVGTAVAEGRPLLVDDVLTEPRYVETVPGTRSALVVPLGSFAGSSYDDLQFDLHGGDLFVFYTDGVPEALDAEGREFGTARLIETVHAARGGKAQAVVDAIFDAVQAFRGNAPPSDDMTAVVVRLMI